MKKICIVLCLSVLAGCTTKPKYSKMQIRSMQSRTFNNSDYNDVFQAFKTVLLDENYLITEQDYKQGLISAKKGETFEPNIPEGAKNFLKVASFFATIHEVTHKKKKKNHNGWVETDVPDKLGIEYKMAVTFDKITESSTETRANYTVTDIYDDGVRQTDSPIEPAVYKNLYNKVTVELKRREAKNSINKNLKN